MPKSREELIDRGYCCGCVCTNCPYTPKYITGNTAVDNQQEVKDLTNDKHQKTKL